MLTKPRAEPINIQVERQQTTHSFLVGGKNNNNNNNSSNNDKTAIWDTCGDEADG